MGDARTSKRTFDEATNGDDEEEEISSTNKYLNCSISPEDNINKSTFQDFCGDIFLTIFQYLRPVDLLYSFTDLFPQLDVLIKPYTHSLDFCLMSKSYFDCLSQSLLPYLTNDLRTLRLSNANTFGQISELVYKFDWSQINQLESLTFDSIKTDELSRYFLVIHSILEHLWRLSITFDEDDKYAERLLIDHILTNQSRSLTYCFINGITFDLNKLTGQKLNENLRELTITLATINDLLILFRIVPRIEILTCTILDSTCSEAIDKIQSLEFVTNLTLTIQKAIAFKNLQKLLLPHMKLKRLSLKAILCDENCKKEIGGFELEKLFRVFSQLTELHFYLRHLQNDDTWLQNNKPDHLYLYPFTSHFWLDRSIHVATHSVVSLKQRYIYTLPFAFDTFDIADDIYRFFSYGSNYYYSNVHHLSFLPSIVLTEFAYSNMILKFFPNIQTIEISNPSSSTSTITILNNHQWVLRKSESNISSTQNCSCVFILNSRKARHLYFQTLNISSIDQRLFLNYSKHARQLTIYEMTEQQWIHLDYFFPWIHILTLYVNTLECFSSPNDWLLRLLTNRTLLFSLTVYYPKNTENEKIMDLLASSLLAVKKHFYIKCNDGVLNIWF